jgi:histidine triad (HIT) family protein
VASGQGDRYTQPEDIVYKDAAITAFVAPKWWINNAGHVLVVPNTHHENIYEIPDELLAQAYLVAKKLAIAMRQTYGCDGTSTRQHNEPAGGQDIWHFHVHVFARYHEDKLYLSDDQTRFAEAHEKQKYANVLRAVLKKTAV